MNQEDMEVEIHNLLGRFGHLTNLQRQYLTYPATVQSYTNQKAVLAGELGKSLREWTEKTEKRTLVSTVIVHSLEDFGSCAKIVADATAARAPAIQQQKLACAIAAFWRDLSFVIPALKPDKVYQDGLPAYDEHPEVVAAIVGRVKTPNYELLRRLRDQEAKVIGTEAWPLLIQERDRLLAGVVNCGREELLKKRDGYIINRISQTLRPREVGVLLIGALHRIELPDEGGIWKVNLPTLLEITIVS